MKTSPCNDGADHDIPQGAGDPHDDVDTCQRVQDVRTQSTYKTIISL
jgi:hypothetical protein